MIWPGNYSSLTRKRAQACGLTLQGAVSFPRHAEVRGKGRAPSEAPLNSTVLRLETTEPVGHGPASIASLLFDEPLAGNPQMSIRHGRY